GGPTHGGVDAVRRGGHRARNVAPRAHVTPRGNVRARRVRAAVRRVGPRSPTARGSRDGGAVGRRAGRADRWRRRRRRRHARPAAGDVLLLAPAVETRFHQIGGLYVRDLQGDPVGDGRVVPLPTLASP